MRNPETERALYKARADLAELRSIASEAVARAEDLEADAEAADARARQAQVNLAFTRDCYYQCCMVYGMGGSYIFQ